MYSFLFFFLKNSFIYLFFLGGGGGGVAAYCSTNVNWVNSRYNFECLFTAYLTQNAII